MGNSSGVLEYQKALSDPFNPTLSTIISDKLRTAAKIFEASPQFRAIFVEYLQTGIWIDTYIRKNKNFSNLHHDILPMLEAWKEKQQQTSSSEDSNNHNMNNYNSRQEGVSHVLQDRGGLHALLVAAAYPIFLESPEFSTWFAPEDRQPNSHLSYLTRSFFPASAATVGYRFRGKSQDESFRGLDVSCCDNNVVRNNHCKDDDEDTVLSAEVSSVLNVDSERSNSLPSPSYSSSSRSGPSSTNNNNNNNNNSNAQDELFEKRQISLQGTKEESRSRFRRLILESLAVMDSLELDRMLEHAQQEWLGELVTFVETLPVAITLSQKSSSTKKPHHHHHQNQHDNAMFYCNRKYEEWTQFARAGIIGQPAHFGLFFTHDNNTTTTSPTSPHYRNSNSNSATTDSSSCSTCSNNNNNDSNSCTANNKGTRNLHCENNKRLHASLSRTGEVFHSITDQLKKDGSTFASLSLLKPVCSTTNTNQHSHSHSHTNTHTNQSKHHHNNNNHSSNSSGGEKEEYIVSLHYDMQVLCQHYHYQQNSSRNNELREECFALNHLLNLLPCLL